MNRPRKADRLTSCFASIALGAVALVASACAPDKMPFKPGETHTFAGGIEADYRVLNAGYQSYMRYCYACHGEKGDGKGPSSYGLRPPPRNFTQGIFKFARLRSSDDVPNDEDLIRIVKGGLHGTAMLPWDIQDDELVNVIQFIKTFAPQKWEKKKKSGEPVKTLEAFEAPADPWDGKEVAAVQRGRELYHLKAECLNCHPSYLGKEDLYKLSAEAAKREPDTFKPITGYRDDPNGSVAKDSAEYGVRLLPPDFTFHPVRSIHEGTEMPDLFRLLSYGVYPIMPAWTGALEDKDIWAIAHYIKSLMAMRDTPAAVKMKEGFTSQASFEVPKPPEPKPEEAAAEGEKKDGETAAVADDKKAGETKADDKKVELKTGYKKEDAPKGDDKGPKKPDGTK